MVDCGLELSTEMSLFKLVNINFESVGNNSCAYLIGCYMASLQRGLLICSSDFGSYFAGLPKLKHIILHITVIGASLPYILGSDRSRQNVNLFPYLFQIVC